MKLCSKKMCLVILMVTIIRFASMYVPGPKIKTQVKADIKKKTFYHSVFICQELLLG